MLRVALRPYLVAVCVFAVSFALLSLVFRHPVQRTNEGYSSRQRGAIVTGAVREAPATQATQEHPPQAASANEAVASNDAEPAAVAKPATRERRGHAIRPHTRRAEKAEPAPTIQPEPAKPVIAQTPAPEEKAPPPVVVPKAVIVESEPLPAPAPAPAPVIHSVTNPAPQNSAAPKTRQQVQDELRRARENGSLPRFGNPDPAGPGGTPSETAGP